MDNRKQALTDLLVKIEAGEFDARTYPLMKLPQMSMNTFDNIHAAYKGSLDAAKALHEAVLHGDWGFRLVEDACDVFDRVAKPVYSGYYHDNPARAWLIAIIKAFIAKADA